MGTAKLYQTEWNNISLIEISEKMGKSVDKIADIDFYKMFYNTLCENDWNLSADFLEEKRALGKAVFNKLNPSKKDHIVSLGAGLGICEAEAIRGGYNIELQEIQADSFKYLEKINVKPIRKWETFDLSILPENYYDSIIINHIMYCFNDCEYKDYMDQVIRLLKPNGNVIVTAELLSESECLRRNLSNSRVLRKLFRKDETRVFWGYLRTEKKHAKMLSSLFDVVEHGQLYDGIQKLGYSYYICKRKYRK